MRFFFLVCVSLFLCFSCDANPQKLRIPKTFQCDGEWYSFDTRFKEFTRVEKIDVDGDKEEETVIMFQGRSGNGDPVAFVFVYGKTFEYRIPLFDYPGEIDAYDINKDGRNELILYSYGGPHYTKLYIYSHDGVGMRKIFENGSSYPVAFEIERGNPLVKVGRADLEETDPLAIKAEYRWQMYTWNGDEFVYDKSMNQSPEISEQQEVKRYLNQAMLLTGDDRPR